MQRPRADSPPPVPGQDRAAGDEAQIQALRAARQAQPVRAAEPQARAIAIDHLLSKAIESTPTGDRVSVQAHGEAEALVVEVEDTREQGEAFGLREAS